MGQATEYVHDEPNLLAFFGAAQSTWSPGPGQRSRFPLLRTCVPD